MSAMDCPEHLTRPRRCALFAKTQHEDPIGTAFPYERWLIVEVPTPWPRNVWQSDQVPAAVRALVSAARELQRGVRPLAIAPDPEYSRPGYTRLLHLRRPTLPFAVYAKDEFLVPSEQVAALIEALFERPTALPRFAPYRQAGALIRDLLVCTHGSQDGCCGTFGYPLYRLARDGYAATSRGRLRAWRVSHFGGHRFAPTLIDFPEGRYWGNLEPAALDLLVRRNGLLPDPRRCYRGWAGLGFFEQVAEREILRHEGWAWTGYLKAGHAIDEDGRAIDPEADPVFDERPPRRVEVRIDFAAPGGSASDAYEATVEFSGRTQGLGECGGEVWERNHYRLTRLVKTGPTPPVEEWRATMSGKGSRR